ncbi:PucR family transcriptional regulator [Streptomyces sp. NRRL B-24484]|uniref:PucR family transcriptional regulator n=1 Tax=Streptomyces sp. NRRL B-24484 TaxID=1463833 RepID=UPI0004C13061|nr:helix-turn-helix domain-containing protein [Streptomyces sp. NRRL B-24484]
MKGLLLRLSALDADAAAAVRVIAHYEALLATAALDATALVRSTAGLAECPAGWQPAGGEPVRFAADGSELPGPPGRSSAAVQLGAAGRVWLERPGPAGPLDDLVLEWMAIAARVVAGGTGAWQVADPALVELVLSEREAEADRARALRLLGLVPERPLRVVAVAGAPGADAGAEAAALFGSGTVPGTVRVAGLGAVGAVLLQQPDPDGATPPAELLRAALADRGRRRGGPRPRGGAPAQGRGTRVGIGGPVDALAAGESWQQARAALRFAVAGTPAEAVADHEALGTVALLADLPAERLRSRPDVRALEELAGREEGAPAVAALAAFCRTGSLRQAAGELHLHHSSVAARLARVEAETGWRLRDPQDRFRAQLAWYAWRLGCCAAD